MNFQNVNKIHDALMSLVLTTPKRRYLLKSRTVLIASFLWIIVKPSANLEGLAVFTEMKLPALLFRRDYKHLVVTSSYLSIMIWLTLNDCWKNKRLKIKRYHSFEEIFVLFCATSHTFFISGLCNWMDAVLIGSYLVFINLYWAVNVAYVIYIYIFLKKLFIYLHLSA